MKLCAKDIDKDGNGYVTLEPQESEDLWHVYNLVQEKSGDLVKAKTIRKVQRETQTGTSESERIPITLTIEVESVDFDPSADVLRLNGRNVSENKYVKMGAYHTLELELHRRFTLSKAEWDSIHLSIVEDACDPSKSADVAAVIMQEGLAHVCLITSSMTILRAKIDTAIPRKRMGSTTNHDKGILKFYENVLQALLRHVDWTIVKCVIIASPGFVKDHYSDYMFSEAVKRDLKVITENKAKFLLCHSSSGFKHSLKEVLASPEISARLADTKATGEVKILDSFYEMLNNEPDRAFYGYNHCRAAQERLAIQVLLVTDSLFRSTDIQTRKKYVALVEDVKEAGGEVKLFSSMHVTGELDLCGNMTTKLHVELAQLSGVAAILRFPLPDIEELEEDHDSDSGQESDSS